MNFLEELAAEWYAFNGYFTRTNIRIEPLAHGGYAGEIDVLAYKPSTPELVHIETSGRAESLSAQRDRFLNNKFNVSGETYMRIVGGPYNTVHQLAIGGHARRPRDLDDSWGDVEAITIPQFIMRVSEGMGNYNPARKAVPEVYPLLRAFQSVVWFGKCKGGD